MLRRRFVSVAAATALLGGATLPAVVLAPVAAAHSVLIAVDPENGGELENSPGQIVLTFNEEINQNFVTVAVTTAGDSTNRVAGEPSVDGDTVTAQVEELGPGDYTVGYRVTSADGHVVSGSSVFSVVGAEAGSGDGAGSGSGEGADAGPAAPGSDATEDPDAGDPATDAGDSDSGGGGIDPVIWVVGGIAVVLIGGAFFLLRRGD